MTGTELFPPKILVWEDASIPVNNGKMRVDRKLMDPAKVKDWYLVYSDRSPKDNE